MADRGRAGRVEVEVEGGWIGASVDDAGDVGTFGGYTVAVDGRPSNLRALTAEQAARGSGAQTVSEVLCAIFGEIGVEQGLSRIEGSVALIVWDAAKRELWAIRDRVGARPMFWRQGPDGVAAGSAPEAVGSGPVDVLAMDRLSRVGLLPPPCSVIEGVRRVPAGCLVRIGAAAAPSRWWDTPATVPGSGGSLARWVQSLEYSARMCVRHAAAAAQAVWVEDAPGLAVLAAAEHPVTGRLPALVIDVAGRERIPDPEGAASVRRVALGPDHLDEALDDLAGLDEPVVDPDALLWWAIGRAAAQEDFAGVMTGRGSEAWLEPATPRFLLRAIRLRPGAADATPRCPEVDAILSAAPTTPPGAGWLQRRLTVPDRTLRTADLVGASAGVSFVAPLCDPRLVQFGCTVPLGHHRGIAPRLWAAMGARSAGPVRATVPLAAWLAGPCAGLLEGVPERLTRFVEPSSLGRWPPRLEGSEAVAERVFGLLVLERWLRGRS